VTLSHHGAQARALKPVPGDPTPSGYDRTVRQRVIESLFEAIERLDTDVLASHLHEHIVYRRPGRPVLIGRDAVASYYKTERPALTSRILVEALFVDGETVIAVGLVEGRSREGALLSERFADVFLFEDVSIRDRTTYFYRTGF
jgi:ketosteroid isomerase-like protein